MKYYVAPAFLRIACLCSLVADAACLFWVENGCTNKLIKTASLKFNKYVRHIHVCRRRTQGAVSRLEDSYTLVSDKCDSLSRHAYQIYHLAAEGTSPWQRLKIGLGDVTGPVRAARGCICLLTAAFCLDRRSVIDDLSEAKGMASSSSSQHSSLKNQVDVLSIYNQKRYVACCTLSYWSAFKWSATNPISTCIFSTLVALSKRADSVAHKFIVAMLF